MNKTEYGKMLKALRENAEKTQREVADRLKVSEQTIRNWEKGRETPRLYIWQVVALCEMLGVSLSELPSYEMSEEQN